MSAISGKSVTFDEPTHLAGAYSYWEYRDFRMNSDRMLPQWLAGLPLYLMHPRFPAPDAPVWVQCDGVRVGMDMLFQYGNDFHKLLMFSRMMIVLLGAALVLLAYRWSSELFGWEGGFITALLCVFSPNLLAHGALVTSDMAATLFFMLSLWTLWRLLHRVTLLRFAVCALSITGLVLSKMTAVLILPIAAIIVAIRVIWGSPLILDFRGRRLVFGKTRMVLLFTSLAIATTGIVIGGVWASSTFRFELTNPNLPPPESKDFEWAPLIAKTGTIGKIVDFAHVHRLLPESYLFGTASVASFLEQRVSFLNGKYSRDGFFWFFPYAFLVKTPAGVFLLLVLAGALSALKWRTARRWLYHLSPLLVFFVVYWLTVLRTHYNIGNRHILPIYPVVYILAGATGLYFRNLTSVPSRRITALRLAVIAALASFVLESLVIRPDYLTYFNVFAGGPRDGWKHMVDSSLDWGQDLPALKRWLDAHGVNNFNDAYLAYFGTGMPYNYGITVRPLTEYGFRDANYRPLRRGVYCISATRLQSIYTIATGHWAKPYEAAYQDFYHKIQRQNDASADPSKKQVEPVSKKDIWIFEELRLARLCAWLRQREPDDEVGHSILIYVLSDEQLHEALDGKPPELWPQL